MGSTSHFIMNAYWNSDGEEEEEEHGGELYDEILDEEEFKFEERKNGNYYIGIPYYDKVFEELLLASSVRSETFFSHSIENVTHYLKNYSVVRTEEPRDVPEIMQLYIHPTTDAYNIVLKTHWLRLVQRTWKNVLQKRKTVLRQWYQPAFLQQREREARNRQVLPSLRGMMSYLKVNK